MDALKTRLDLCTLLFSDARLFNFQGPSDGTTVDMKSHRKLLKDIQLDDEPTADCFRQQDVQPDVSFLTNSDVVSLIRRLKLNAERSRAFQIICNHALGRHPPHESQLLMAVFGAGG